MHPGWVILDDDPGAGWVWRLQPQYPVRAVPVVVLDVDAQDPIQVALPDDQQPVQLGDGTVPTGFKTVENRTTSTGVVALTLRTTGTPPKGEVGESPKSREQPRLSR